MIFIPSCYTVILKANSNIITQVLKIKTHMRTKRFLLLTIVMFIFVIHTIFLKTSTLYFKQQKSLNVH